MKPSSFWQQLLLALALSVIGVVLHTALTMILGPSLSIRISLPAIATVYLLALLRGSPKRSGRVLAVLALLCLSGGLVLFNPPLWAWVLLLTAGVWLLRSLLRYNSLIPAGIDALVCALALAAGIATARHTGSLFLCLWSYFLVQALLALLPFSARGMSHTTPADDDFDTAYRNAEAALRRLSLRS